MKIITGVLFSLVLFTSISFSQNGIPYGTGLESYLKDSIYILCSLDIGENSGIQLTTQEVYNKFAFKIISAGFTPVKIDINDSYPLGQYASVTVSTIGNAFTIRIGFNRWVTYWSGGHQYALFGDTYGYGRYGVYYENKDYILETLGGAAEDFVVKFKTSN